MTLSDPRSLSALVLSTALAACGGSSSTTTTFIDPIQANGLPWANGQIVETSTLAGNTIQTDSTRLEFQGSSSGPLSASTSNVAIKVVDADTIQLTSGAQTWTLQLSSTQNSNGDSLWIAQRGISGNPSNLSATFGQTDVNDPTSLQSIFFGNISELPDILPATTAAGAIFLISGFETNPDDIDALRASNATANYQGQTLIASDQSAGTDPLLLLDGPSGMDVTVDYGSSTVSGTLRGTASGFGGGELVVDLASTTIGNGDNSFTTTASRSSSSTSTGVTALSGTVTGTLFGTDAAEMGISLLGTATTTSSGTVDAAGYALGTKQ